MSPHHRRLPSRTSADDRSTARAFGPACFEGFTNYHWIYCELAFSSANVQVLTVRAGTHTGWSACCFVLYDSQTGQLLESKS